MHVSDKTITVCGQKTSRLRKTPIGLKTKFDLFICQGKHIAEDGGVDVKTGAGTFRKQFLIPISFAAVTAGSAIRLDRFSPLLCQ